MNKFIKNNINTLVGTFLLLSPIIDLITGLSLHLYNNSFTLGIVIRFLFLFLIIYSCLFVYKKKELLIPLIIIGIYIIFYSLGIIMFRDKAFFFQEIQKMIKVFYFPILFISFYTIKDKIRISSLTLLTTMFIYLFAIFIPTLLGIGFKTYTITKSGTLGFYNSANEISGIISLLTPLMFIVLTSSKKNIPRIILLIIYLTVILMMGTKTPLLTLGLTVCFSLLYLWLICLKKRNYKPFVLSLIIVFIGTISIIKIIPNTNFYKNIETHLDYLGLDSITDVFKDEKLIDHFIFSQRLTFLNKKALLYKEASTYEKIFGIGYYNNSKETKMIEMDYFDIYYSHGVVGFLIVFIVSIYSLYKVLEKRQLLTYRKYMLNLSLLLMLFLSFFTGHIITAPSVSIICIILILSMSTRKKKDLLFAGKDLGLGGIEMAQINLLDNIDYTKYNVTLVLEEKRGELLKQLNKRVRVKELKVSAIKNPLIRKPINVTRKLIFKIFNYQNYDFSCCYTTYSYSSNKIALMTSKNNALYVHSDYSYLYKKEEDYREFFDTRNIYDYHHIIFVSNESKKAFLKYYKELDYKTQVLNNFIDTNKIKELSKEPIEETKDNTKKLFVFVGRLDDTSKKLKRAINLAHEIKNIELWIIGDGPDREMYEDYAKKNNRVKFLGKKENPYPYMNKADYIILTSDYEGFPVTYLEALVLNKQIITTIKTSDESINIEEYAYIIPKDEKAMLKEVKKILNFDVKKKKINIDSIQKYRIQLFEELFED